MNRTLVLFAIIVFIFIPDRSTARIGETPQKCQERYGKPFTDKEDEIVGYKKSGLYIMIDFYEGKAEMISFRKIKQNILRMAEKLSDNEILTLLKANGGKRVWKIRDSISADKEWETEDGEILAQYSIFENILYISTKDCLDRHAEERKAKEEEKLDDF